MAIQFHTLRPATVPVITAQSNQTHAAASGAKTSSVKLNSAFAELGRTDAATDFRSTLSSGLAAAGAASAEARSAATAAAAATAKNTAAAASPTATATATTPPAPPTRLQRPLPTRMPCSRRSRFSARIHG